VFEPLLLHLFLLHASVNLVNFSVRYLKFLFTQFLFPDRLTVLMIFIFVESVSYFSVVFQPTKTDAQKIFAPQFPGVISLNSKVLWSILSSTIIEVLKKRWTLLKLICPEQADQENSDMEGMPPAYIVVDTSWEDLDDDDDPHQVEIVLEENKIDTKIENIENILDNQIGTKNPNFIKNYWTTLKFISVPKYSLWPQDYWHCRIITWYLQLVGKQLKDEESFNSANWHCLQQLEDVKLSKMLKEVQLVQAQHLPCAPGGDGGLLFSIEDYEEHCTKDCKGKWYILAGKVNLFLANSAVGVIISFALITDQNSSDETKDYKVDNVGRKAKNKERKVSWIQSNCRALSPNNYKESVITTANKLTQVA